MAAVWPYLIPVIVLAALLVLFGTFLVLARVKGGRYLRPIVELLSRVPLLRRAFLRMSRAALERQNPALASAVAKLERAGATRDPQRAQAALARLTAEERKAWLAAAAEQGQLPDPTNRAERRRQRRLQP